MLAALCVAQSDSDPLSGLRVGEHPEAEIPPGWVRVHVRAAALNRHDVWSLRGVGLRADRLPMVLGCDAAGVTDDGTPVVVHSVIADPTWQGDDETLDGRRTLLSEVYPGTLAERLVVPARNLVAKPEGLSFEAAACLPTAWLTAYRMLFTQAGVQPGDRVLIQGAGGGLSTAAIALASAAGLVVWVTSRDERKRVRALEIGANGAFPPGARLPERVDAVIESVGEATWEHSMNCVRPGGTIVVAGATAGRLPRVDLFRVTLMQIRIVGSTMGTRDELEQLVSFCSAAQISPVIDEVMPLADIGRGFARMHEGDLFGKIVAALG